MIDLFSNDRLGLTKAPGAYSTWTVVPKETPRPESVVLAERVGGIARDTDAKISGATALKRRNPYGRSKKRSAQA